MQQQYSLKYTKLHFIGKGDAEIYPIGYMYFEVAAQIPAALEF